MTGAADRRGWRRFAGAALLLVGPLLAGAGAAHAQGAQPAGAAQPSCAETRPADNVAVLDCAPGYATAHDRLLVYRRGPAAAGPAAAAGPRALDTTNAVWLFDVGATGDARLLIDFRPSGGGLVADLYDDRDGDGRVRFALRDGVPQILESARPTVSFSAPDGWWERDGAVNFNLEIAVDGDVIGAFGTEHLLGNFRNDGLRDYLARVVDADRDGRPDAETIQVAPDAALGGAFVRTQVFLNVADDEVPITNAVFWPYLGRGQLAGHPSVAAYRAATGGWPCSVTKAYRDSPPPVRVAWEQGKIICLGEFVASRFNEHNWFSYSIERQFTGARPANWESPFAFYDLAGDGDGIPELIVRVVNWNPRDPYADVPSDYPLNLVRYSWDQRNHPAGVHQSYKVDLVGAHPVTSTVTVQGPGALTVTAIPYGELPRWVVGRRWGITAFVAVERERYESSEGIYEWDSVEPEWRFAAGGAETLDAGAVYGDIAAGLRGDYRTQEAGEPWLYLSPIDHKLHLLGAEGGVWNVDGRDRVRYAPLDGQHVGRWSLERDGAAVAALYHARDQLLYADEGGVHTKPVAAEPAALVALPPTTPQEWERLGSDLARHGAPPGGAGPPPDLRGLFDAFPTRASVAEGASIADLRLTDEGFRFLGHLRGASPAAEGWSRGLGPGTYVVSYRPGDGYAARPAAPARLEVGAVEPPGDAARQPVLPILVPARLRVAVRNTGDEDAHGVPIAFRARSAGGVTDIARVTVDVPGGGETLAGASWTPRTPGEWRIEAAAPDGAASPPTVVRVAVGAAGTAGAGWGGILAAQGLPGRLRVASAVALGTTVALATGIAYVLWRPATRATASGERRSRARPGVRAGAGNRGGGDG